MKKFLSIGLAIFLFSGCGGGGGSDTSNKATVDSALKIGDVVFSAPQDIDFNNKTRMTMKRQKRFLKQKYIQKVTESCGISGTYDADQNYDGTYIIVFHDCIEYDETTGLVAYYNGKLTMSENGENFTLYDYTEIPDYYNAMGDGTYYKDVSIYYHNENYLEEMKIDGTVDEYKNGYIYETMTYRNIILKNNKTDNSWYFSGGFYDKAGCFSEDHNYKTDDKDWLIESSVNPDYFESGTLYVDNIKYVYHGDEVTVTKDGKTGTFTQQELLDELNKKRNETECSL